MVRFVADRILAVQPKSRLVRVALPRGNLGLGIDDDWICRLAQQTTALGPRIDELVGRLWVQAAGRPAAFTTRLHRWSGGQRCPCGKGRISDADRIDREVGGQGRPGAGGPIRTVAAAGRGDLAAPPRLPRNDPRQRPALMPVSAASRRVRRRRQGSRACRRRRRR